MLLQRIVRFFSGSRLLRADACLRDTLLDRLLACCIVFRSAMPEETDGSITFRISEKEAARLFQCLEQEGLPLPETVSSHGMPHLFRLYRRRAGLLVGALAAIPLTAFSSQFVWGEETGVTDAVTSDIVSSEATDPETEPVFSEETPSVSPRVAASAAENDMSQEHSVENEAVKSVEISNPTPSTMLTADSEEENASTALDRAVQEVKTESSIRYTNISDNVDIQYILNGDSLKENIIVKSKQDVSQFRFVL